MLESHLALLFRWVPDCPFLLLVSGRWMVALPGQDGEDGVVDMRQRTLD